MQSGSALHESVGHWMKWTREELDEMARLRDVEKLPFKEIAHKLRRREQAVRARYYAFSAP